MCTRERGASLGAALRLLLPALELLRKLHGSSGYLQCDEIDDSIDGLKKAAETLTNQGRRGVGVGVCHRLFSKRENKDNNSLISYR